MTTFETDPDTGLRLMRFKDEEGKWHTCPVPKEAPVEEERGAAASSQSSTGPDPPTVSSANAALIAKGKYVELEGLFGSKASDWGTLSGWIRAFTAFARERIRHYPSSAAGLLTYQARVVAAHDLCQERRLVAGWIQKDQEWRRMAAEEPAFQHSTGQ